MSTTVIGGRYWYRKEDKSGEGNYGAVYRAYDINQTNYNKQEQNIDFEENKERELIKQDKKCTSQSQLQSTFNNGKMHKQHNNTKNNDNKNREKYKQDDNTGMHMSNMIKSKAINENAVQRDITNEEQTMESEVYDVDTTSLTDDNKTVNTNNLECFSNDENKNNNNINNNINGQCEDTHFDTSDIVALKIMENKYESSGIDTSVIHEIMILHKIAQEYTHYMQSKRRLVRCSVDTTASASKNTLQKAFTPTTAKTTRRRKSTFTHNNMVELNGHVKSDINTKSASRENNESDFALQNKPLLKFIPRKHFFENDNRKIEDKSNFIIETNKAISLPDGKRNVENYCDTTRDTRNEAVYNPLHTFCFPTQLSECEFSLQNDTNDISVTTKRVETNNAETASLQSLEKYNCDDMCNLEEQNEFESEERKECLNAQELSLVSYMMDYYHDADEAKHNMESIENKDAMYVNKKLEEESSNKTLIKPENGSVSKANNIYQENDSRLGLEKSSTLHSLHTDEKFNDKSKIYSDNTKIVNDYHETRCKNIEQMCEEAMPRQNKEIKQDQNESVYEQKECEKQMQEKFYPMEKQQEQLQYEEWEEYLQSCNEDLYYCVDAVEELRQSGVEHIVQMRDVIIDSERNSVYLIMEYCDGGNLRRYLQHLPEHKITDKILYRRWSAEITSALAFLHSQHISHCDLKTENILLQRESPLQIQENQILSSESYHEHEENEVLSLEEANSHEEMNSLHSCKNNVTASDQSVYSSNDSNKETSPKGLSTNHTRHVLRETTCKNKENFILKLCDFGLSHVEDIPVKKFKHPAVTLWYRPPDVLLNNMHYTYTADAWSLGCVLLEMAVGVAPFRAFNEYEELKCIFKRLGKPTKRNFPSAHHYPCPSLLLTLIDFDETDTNEIVKANFSKKSHKESKSNSSHNKETVNTNTTTITTTTNNGCLSKANFNDKKRKESTHKHSKDETLVNTYYDNVHGTTDNSTVINNNKEGHNYHSSTDDIEKTSNILPSQEFSKRNQEMERTNTKTLLEQNVQEVRRRLRKYLQAHNSLKVLGRSGLDLVSRLLQYEPAYRLTVMEALHHPFFSNEARSLCARRFHEFHMLCKKEEQELKVQHLTEQAAFHAQGGKKNLLLQPLQLPSSSSLSVQSTPFPCTVNTRCRHDQKHLVSSLENVKQENKLHESKKNDNVDLEKSSANCLKQSRISATCVSKDRNAEKTQGVNIKNNDEYNRGDDNNALVNNNDIINNNTDDTVEEKCNNSLTTLSLQMSSWPPLLEPLDCPLPPHPTTANASSISSSSFALHDNASSTSLSTFPETHPLTESSLSLPSKEKEHLCTVSNTNQNAQISTQNTHNEMPNRLSQSTPSISATTTNSTSTSTSTSSTFSEKCGLIASHTGHSTFALVPPSCQAIRYPRNSRELPPLPLPQRHRLSSMEIKHMNELHPLSTSWQMLTSSSSTSLSASSSSKSFSSKLDPLSHEQLEERQEEREKQHHQCEESTKHRLHCANNNEIKISKEDKDDKNKKLYADNHRVHARKNNNKLSPIIESKIEDHAALSEEMESIPVDNTPNAKDVENKNNKLNVANNDNSENRSKGQINTSNKYKSIQHDNKTKQRKNETNKVDPVYMLNQVNNAQQMLASAFVTKLRQMHSKSFVELEKNNTSGKNKNKIDDKQMLSTILIKTADQNEYRDIS